MNSKRIAVLGIGIGLLPLWVQASDFGQGLANLSPSITLESRDGRNTHWSGIGNLKIKNGFTCSATLLDTRSAASPSDAPAYLLTSGHCVEKRNGLMVTDRAVEGSVQFNLFTDTTPLAFALKRINWSSIQGVDLALVELKAPLREVIAAGIEPMKVAGQPPAAGEDILLLGVPQGFGGDHLRLAACTQQDSGDVLEQPWFWRSTVKNQCRDVRQGSSGSPLLTRASNEVFAVLGTSTQNNQTGTLELPQGFPLLSPGSNYGNPVTFMQACFVNGVLSQDPAQCALFPTFSVTFKSPPKQYAKPRLDDENRAIYPRWDLSFSLNTAFYRYKVVDRAEACENPHDYSPATLANDARINDAIGPRVGMHMLCMLGVSSAEERPSAGLMRNALTLATELLPAGPTEMPKLNIKTVGKGYVLSTVYDPRVASRHTRKFGPPQSTDCGDPQGYFRALSPYFQAGPPRLPMKVCTQAFDLNGQASPVREDLLPVIVDAGTPAKQTGTKIIRIGLPPQE